MSNETKTIRLENKEDITNVMTKLKNCEVEYKQVTFPDDETQATFYLVAWSVDDSDESYRRFVSEVFDYEFKKELEDKLEDENWSLRTNLNHDIKTIWDYISNGLSIDLDYKGESYTFSKGIHGERLDLTYLNKGDSKVIGEITQDKNDKFIVEIYEVPPHWEPKKYKDIVEFEDIHELNEMCEFDEMVKE